MDTTENRFKAGLQTGRTMLGVWSSMCSPISADIIAGSGIDWALIDMEHAPNEVPDVVAQLRSYDSSPVEAIVRPPWNDTVIIKRLLDGGVRSLLIPFVQDAEDARSAVAATRYPPEGVRGLTISGRGVGYGRRIGELGSMSDGICVIVQIETAEAVSNLEGIASVTGVDGVFVGPSDLSASMGYLGNPGADAVQDAILDVGKRLAALNVPGGILCTSDELAHRYAEWGFRFLSVGSDVGFVRAGVDRVADLKIGPSG